MKRRNLMIVAMLCGVVLMTACHRGPNYATLIPSDVVMVMDMQLDQLYKKGDLKHADELTMMKLLKGELQNEDEKTSALVNDLLENPASTGLDLMGDLVFYVDESLNSVMLMPMRSQRKFEKFLARVAGDEDLKIEKRDGMRMLAGVDLPVKLAWDKEKVVLMLHSDDNSEGLMKMEKEASIYKNSDFIDFWKNRGDISFWYRMDGFLGMVEELQATLGMDVELDYLDGCYDLFRGVSCYFNINYEKGLVRMEMETQGVDKGSEMMKLYDKKWNTKLMDFVPEPTFLALTAAVDMEQYLALMSKMGVNKETLEMELFDGFTLRDILGCLEGSIAGNLYGFTASEKGSLLPLFSVAADLKDVAKVKGILAQAGLEQADEDLWKVPNTTLYIGLKDKILFVTDEADGATKMMGKGYKNGLKAVAKKAKKGNYFYADLAIDHYPDVVKVLLNGDLMNLLRQFLDYTEAYQTSALGGEWVFYLADKKQNSLAATIHFIDDNLLRFGSLFQGLGNTDCPEVTEEFYVEEDSVLAWDE